MPNSGDRDRFRRRTIAAAGIWFLLAGLLTALSLVVVALALTVLLALGLVAAPVFGRLRRIRVRPALERASRATIRTAARAPRPSRSLAARALRGSIGGLYRVGLLRRRSIDLGERALALNARGAELRRSGEPEQAASRHRAALAIVRDLGDPQAEALTLNNLGLALAHGGAEQEAVERLEEAIEVLRGLGDEEHEARVIANLGVVHRRQGHDEEATSLLTQALDKLPPESAAYRRFEAELLRAS